MDKKTTTSKERNNHVLAAASQVSGSSIGSSHATEEYPGFFFDWRSRMQMMYHPYNHASSMTPASSSSFLLPSPYTFSSGFSTRSTSSQHEFLQRIFRMHPLLLGMPVHAAQDHDALMTMTNKASGGDTTSTTSPTKSSSTTNHSTAASTSGSRSCCLFPAENDVSFSAFTPYFRRITSEDHASSASKRSSLQLHPHLFEKNHHHDVRGGSDSWLALPFKRNNNNIHAEKQQQHEESRQERHLK